MKKELTIILIGLLVMTPVLAISLPNGFDEKWELRQHVEDSSDSALVILDDLKTACKNVEGLPGEIVTNDSVYIYKTTTKAVAFSLWGRPETVNCNQNTYTKRFYEYTSPWSGNTWLRTDRRWSQRHSQQLFRITLDLDTNDIEYLTFNKKINGTLEFPLVNP